MEKTKGLKMAETRAGWQIGIQIEVTPLKEGIGPLSVENMQQLILDIRAQIERGGIVAFRGGYMAVPVSPYDEPLRL